MTVRSLLVGPRTKPGAIAILREARRLVARPHGWTQGRYSRARPGHDGDAFCAIGALQEAAAHLPWVGSLHAAQRAVAYVIGTSRIVDWNDDAKRKKRQVVAAFDAAIQLVESAPIKENPS